METVFQKLLAFASATLKDYHFMLMK